MKKAFTLLELMVVLSIIGVLLGLVISVASSSVQWSREWKASALCKVVQAGLAEYKVHEKKWPSYDIDYKYPNENKGLREPLTPESVKEVIHEVVKYSINECPIMDVTQLHVAGADGSNGVCYPETRFYGRTFMEAVKCSEKYPEKKDLIDSTLMYFGYPDKKHGYFRSFKIWYSKATDTMEVTKQ